MNTRRGHMFWAALACLLAAWAILFLGDIAGLGVAARAPFWVPLILLFASAGLGAGTAVSRRTRTTLAAAMVLLAVALLAQRLAAGDEKALQKRWRHDTSLRIASSVAAVAEQVDRLEELSSDIGARVSAHMAGETDGAEPFATFAVLDSIADEATASGVLPTGTQIGIQVFHDGRRLAWSGWPQTLGELDLVLAQSGTELIYSRKVSLYRILTHLIPVRDEGGAVRATVVVDMPLEVDYRVNNRFLKSASLADNIGSAGLAEVSFNYYPVIGNLADRLPRFRQVRERNLEQRMRRIAAAAGRAHDDSLLSYYPFPVSVEPSGEIGGDVESGLRARAVIHSPQGNPVVGVSVVSHPWRHDAGVRAFRFGLWSKTSIVIALLALFALLMARLRDVGGAVIVAARATLFAGFMVLLRYALLSFGTATPGGAHRVFDPTVFATPTLGGIMRSAGDLLITAVFFITLLYGVVKIVRGALDEADGKRPPPEGASGWGVIPRAVVVAGAVWAVLELSRRLVGTVVVNANPRLLGETTRLASVEVLVLHVSLFLLLTGILLAGVFLVWAMFRVSRTGTRGITRTAILALAGVFAIAAATQRWETVLIAFPVIAFIAWAPRFVRREDLVSFVIVAFALVVISSGIGYLYLTHDYDDLRKNFVLEKSRELLDPSDNWKVVILEDVLSDLAQRPEIRQAVRSPGSLDVSRLAFDLWAESPLSLLGYSCAIHLLDAEDNTISDFAVDMPYRVRISEGGERIDTPDDNDWAVLDLTRSTPQGIVRFYRGVLNVSDILVEGDRLERQFAGKVVIDLPFFFESLELAARTGPRTPELLRNVQEGSVAPRIEEPEALLLARVEGRQIYESSSDKLPVGAYVPPAVFERAREGRWPLLRAAGSTYRVILHETEETDRFLLAGFAAPSFRRHLLRWSTLFSLYLFFAFVMIVTTILLGVIPALQRYLPSLTPGRRLGFQQKLLASFLAVALVPAIILGLFAVDFIRDRFVEQNEREALSRAFSARKAMTNLLHGEQQFFLAQARADTLFARGSATLSLDDRRLVKIFADTGDVLQRGVPDIPIAGVLHEVSTEDLFVIHQDGTPFIGVVSAPVRVSGGAWEGAFYVYYARRVDRLLLGEIADQVGADVNVYDDGELVASSREGLLAGGFISSTMNADAFVKVSLLSADHSMTTERAGRYQYQVAYLPVNSWGEATTFDDDSILAPARRESPANAAMSVPLVFRPESYYLEVQKATSVILGIFALLFTATIALGLVLARGIFQPLRALLAGTRSISQGDFNVRLPVRSSDEIGSVVRAFNEMTEQVAQSQQTLVERRQYLETILQNIGTGVISTDGHGHVRTVNAAAGRILGIPPVEIIGRTAAELIDAGKAPEIFSLLAAQPGAGRFVSDEVELARGERKATIKYMRTRLEHEGAYRGTVFVFEDLTELIQSKKLSAWVEMARQIAHEIKNPLTPIRISTQFMQRAYEQKASQFDRIFHEGTETIMQQVDVLKRIASEFSSYGRMQQLRVESCPLDPMIRTIVSPYEKNESGVAVHYDNGVADARVMVDPEAVRKICSNLIENALEAMPDGGDLRVACEEVSDNGGRMIRVSFRDTGPGLSPDVAERLFEPYFSTKTTGTGLGLAICRTLSQEMGGDVTVRNVRDGRGVEAALTLRRDAQD